MSFRPPAIVFFMNATWSLGIIFPILLCKIYCCMGSRLFIRADHCWAISAMLAFSAYFSDSDIASLLLWVAINSAINCSCLARGILFIVSLSLIFWSSGMVSAISLNCFYSFSRCLVVYSRTFLSDFFLYLAFYSASIDLMIAMIWGLSSCMRAWAFANSGPYISMAT